MKKAIALVLVLTMSLSLCACSKECDCGCAYCCGENIENTVATSEENITNTDHIEFAEPILLVEDENVKVEILGFQKEYISASLLSFYGLAGENQSSLLMDCSVTFQFYNKTDHILDVMINDMYIGSEGVHFYGKEGYMLSPAAQKSMTGNYYIRWNPDTKLTSIEDLYQLNGSFDIIHNFENKRSGYDLAFSVESAFQGNTNTEEITTLSLGTSVETDMVKFTLTGFGFSFALSDRNTIYTPENDMFFAKIDCTIENIGKESIETHDRVSFAVDYNEGFTYTMDDHTCYIVHEHGLLKAFNSGGHSGIESILSPLVSRGYEYYIPVSSRVKEDSASPLMIIVTLPSTTGSEKFTYRIH